ncbi:MAG: pyridoxamine 5'-phosphate oxidase family protein [Actinomycetota bacterium]
MALQPYFDIAFTPSVLDLQKAKGSREMNAANHERTVTNPRLGHAEIAHIAARDSLYMATVGETGWPYVQHKGGEPGWVKVLGSTTIGWLERNGNKQYLGTGNLAANDRVALILVDYPNRTRLKVYGRATYHAELDTYLAGVLEADGERHDGATTIEVDAVAWNCPKYLTPRFTQPEVQVAFDEHTRELRARIAELEAEVEQLRHADPSGGS